MKTITTIDIPVLLLLMGVTLLGSSPVTASIGGQGVRAIIKQALTSVDGKAQGSLSSREQEALQSITKGERPTVVTAEVIHKFDARCGRVRLAFVQPDALTQGGSRLPIGSNLVLSVCTDGTPYVPHEGKSQSRAFSPDP